MAQNQGNDYQNNQGTSDKEEGFEVTNQGQNLGGGKGNAAQNVNPANVMDQLGGKEDDFRKTDQSISQAAPGQTNTNTMQGGSAA